VHLSIYNPYSIVKETSGVDALKTEQERQGDKSLPAPSLALGTDGFLSTWELNSRPHYCGEKEAP